MNLFYHVYVFLIFLSCPLFINGEALLLTPSQVKEVYEAKASLDGQVLHLETATPEWSAGVRLLPPDGMTHWDFSTAKYLAADVENLSTDHQMRLTMHITSGSREERNEREARTGVGLNPREKRTMKIQLPHHFIYAAPENGHGMRTIDSKLVDEIQFQMLWPFEPKQPGLINCLISNIRLEGKPDTEALVPENTYLPFVDRYGQYAHSDWPEKVTRDEQLQAFHAEELAELERTSAPESWDRFGGLKNGPQLKATGSFRTEKIADKWYFVTPEGKLFWSLGIDVLRNYTDATDGRKHPDWYDHELPANGSLPFTHWNLQKKYGKDDYKDDFYQVLTKRMQAWGINTIGNWGSKDLMQLGKVPYTLSLTEFGGNGFPRFEGVKVKFYDVFDPEFEVKMGNLLRDRSKADPLVRRSLTDPMCIGYFIDNELQFDVIMKALIKADSDQPGKLAFVKMLMDKYDDLQSLNLAWNCSFATWGDIANLRKAPEGEGYQKDSDLFHARFVERYFEICRKGIKDVAPDRLYLGCRFVGFRQKAYVMKATARYCDVISINAYTNSIANADRSSFHDKPVLMGEFHFGTLGRGMFSGGLSPVYSQQERAISFLRYVQGALVHPNVIGTHYFQFRDQPLTGRWDGEGYQMGFVDVCDTPYPEMTRMARKIGEHMYSYRKIGVLSNDMQ